MRTYRLDMTYSQLELRDLAQTAALGPRRAGHRH
jgi:hypothetical protein